LKSAFAIESLAGVKEHAREHRKIAPPQLDSAEWMFEHFVVAAALSSECGAHYCTVCAIISGVCVST
jgi:hypothetical protein